MKYLHTMVRVSDLDASLKFYCDALGLRELRRSENQGGRYTLVFLAAPGDDAAQVELTFNWDEQGPWEPPRAPEGALPPEGAQGALGRPGTALAGGRNFGHLAYAVDDIYATCRKLMEHGVTISRPPRDGRMAFVRSPDGISVELLQAGPSLAPAEPWTSMPNTGAW